MTTLEILTTIALGFGSILALIAIFVYGIAFLAAFSEHWTYSNWVRAMVLSPLFVFIFFGFGLLITGEKHTPKEPAAINQQVKQ